MLYINFVLKSQSVFYFVLFLKTIYHFLDFNFYGFAASSTSSISAPPVIAAPTPEPKPVPVTASPAPEPKRKRPRMDATVESVSWKDI